MAETRVGTRRAYPYVPQSQWAAPGVDLAQAGSAAGQRGAITVTVGKVTRVASAAPPGRSSPASQIAIEKAAAAKAKPISIQDSDERKFPRPVPEEKLKSFMVPSLRFPWNNAKRHRARFK
jgi:hypothetical protein